MHSFSSRFIQILLFILILFALLIAFLPTIISTDWGRKQTVAWINRSIPGKVEIRHLSLHWGKGQKMEGFLLKDPEGQPVVEFDQFLTQATLWQLIQKTLHLDFTQVKNLNATIIINQTGNTNLERALGLQTHPISPSSPSTIILSDVNIESYLFVPNHPLSAHIKGLTQQNHTNGSFDIHFSLNDLEASNWEQLKRNAPHYFNNKGNKEATFNAQIINFPVDLIDSLIALQNSHLNGVFHSLIGDQLNLHIDKEPSDEGVAFKLTLKTTLMQGDLQGIIKKEGLLLKKPTLFGIALLPQFINSFLHSHAPISLVNPSRFEIALSKLFIPLDFFIDNKKSDPCTFGLDAELRIPDKTELEVDFAGNIEVLTIQAHLMSQPCDKLIHITMIGQAQQDRKPFDLHLTSTINKPQNLSNVVQQMGQNIHSTLTISQFPLSIFPLFYKHPEWSDKLGSYLDAQLEIQSKSTQEWLGTLSFQTPTLILEEAKLSLGKDIQLLSPAYFHWNISPDTFLTFLPEKQLTLNQAHPLNFVIKQFHMPIANLHLTNLELESSVPHLSFSSLENWGTLQLNDLLLHIQSQNLGDFTSHLTGKISLFNLNDHPSPLIPEPLSLKLNSEWKINKNGLIEMPIGQLQLANSITKIQIETAINSQQILELTQPSYIEYLLSPAALHTLEEILHRKLPPLQENVPIQLTIDPSEFDLKRISFSTLYLQGILQIKKIVFQDHAGDPPILEDMMMTWVIDSPRNNIYTNIKGLAYTQKENKPSQMSAHMQFWLPPGYRDLMQTRSEIRMNFSGMPTSMLNILFGMPDLNPIVGPILDLNLKTFYDPTREKPGYLDLVIDSTHFHAEGRFSLSDQVAIYEGNKQPILRLTVTPESYQHMRKLMGLQRDHQLSTPFTATGVLSTFRIPIQSMWAEQAAFDFKFSTTHIQWQDKEIPSWTLEGLLATQNLADHFNFLVKAQAKTPLLIEGSISQLFDKKNRLRHWHEMTIKGEVDGQELTPAFLRSLLFLTSEQKQQLQALFGEILNIHAVGHLQALSGSLKTSIQGTSGHIQINGQLQKGVLTLNQPLEVSTKMTPFFIQTFLTPYVPLLKTAVGAENPLTLKVDPLQFSCPLIPFQLEQVKIGKGNLNLGKINFRNEGELQSVLNMVKPLTGPYFTIWFTPIFFNLNQGILSLKRFDMLIANAYTLANWGSMNVMKQQADFVLGLPAQTLQYAFGVQGLDDHYILQIPLHIAKGKVEVDKKKVTARISSLIAQTHGGEKGKLLGNILDRVLSEKGEAYPPPTVDSFPWQGAFNSSLKTSMPPDQPKEESSAQSQENNDNITQKKKKKEKYLSEENLKSLKQGAMQLLEQWLK